MFGFVQGEIVMVGGGGGEGSPLYPDQLRKTKSEKHGFNEETNGPTGAVQRDRAQINVNQRALELEKLSQRDTKKSGDGGVDVAEVGVSVYATPPGNQGELLPLALQLLRCSRVS